MASVSIEYPDAQGKRIADAMCFDGGWSADLGVTRAAFTKAHIASIVRQRVLEVERDMARQAAMSSLVEPSPVDVT